MMEKVKTATQMERHLKGAANHRRIELLFLISTYNGITLESLVEKLDVSQKTLSEHTRRLAQAGLVVKKYKGRFVSHSLSPYGKVFVTFLKSFQKL